MSTLGLMHLIFSCIAIGAGGVVVLMSKGTRWHRTLGHVYAMAMIGVVGTAFGIYDLTGSFGPFHFAALVGGLTLIAGMWTVLWRRPRKSWIEAHATWMSWSYIGLMAAFCAESLTRFVMPRVATFLDGNALWSVFWTAVGVTSFGVAALGWWLVKTRLPRAVEKTPAAIRREREKLRSMDRMATEV